MYIVIGHKTFVQHVYLCPRERLFYDHHLQYYTKFKPYIYIYTILYYSIIHTFTRIHNIIVIIVTCKRIIYDTTLVSNTI